MRTCPDCGERVYNLGCVNCNEDAYIEEQIRLTDRDYPDEEVADALEDLGVGQPEDGTT